MAINLTLRWSHPGASAAFVRYARVDNTNTPVYTIVTPNPVITPNVTVLSVATNLPNGQYVIESTPIYADGRNCSADAVYTPSCDGLVSISAYINTGNLIIQWTAPTYVPKARITVNWPNGGQSVANYNNMSVTNVTTMPVPPGNTGDITVLGQSVCDESSGFYSPYSNQVVVTNSGGTNPIPGYFVIGNNINTLCNGSATTLYTNGAFAIGSILYADSGLTTPLAGYAYAAPTGGGVIYTISSLTGEVLTNTGQACNVHVVNQILTNNFKINAVTGIPGYTLGAAVTSGSQSSGTRTAAPFSAVTDFNVTADTPTAGKATLLKNMMPVDCVTFTVDGTYSFSYQSFLATDSISIYVQTGSC